MKKLFILIAFAFLFISCEEPDDPPRPYSLSMPRAIGKTATSIDILWDEAPVTNSNFQSYDVYYREFYVAEPKHYINIINKKQVYTSIAGLIPNTIYRIYIVITDKDGNRYTSNELPEMTLNDAPGPIYMFRIDQYIVNIDKEGQILHNLMLVWSPYEDADIVPFSHYAVHLDSVSNFTCTASNKIFDAVRANELFNINHLSGGKTYFLKIRAYNVLGKYSEATMSFIRLPNSTPPGIYYL